MSKHTYLGLSYRTHDRGGGWFSGEVYYLGESIFESPLYLKRTSAKLDCLKVIESCKRLLQLQLAQRKSDVDAEDRHAGERRAA